LDLQLGAGDAAIGVEIAPAGGVDDLGGQSGRRGFAVPAAGAAFGIEIIRSGCLSKLGCGRPG